MHLAVKRSAIHDKRRPWRRNNPASLVPSVSTYLLQMSTLYYLRASLPVSQACHARLPGYLYTYRYQYYYLTYLGFYLQGNFLCETLTKERPNRFTDSRRTGWLLKLWQGLYLNMAHYSSTYVWPRA